LRSVERWALGTAGSDAGFTQGWKSRKWSMQVLRFGAVRWNDDAPQSNHL